MSAVEQFDRPNPAAALTPRGDTIRTVPASFGQEGLWFLRQIMPCKAGYNTAVRQRLSGELDPGALAAAMREVARRHDSFRTTFTLVDGAVMQVVSSAETADVAVVDLEGQPDPEAAAGRIARELAAAVFDLETGPLLRARVLRIGPRDHVLVVVVDHIVADGTSLGIIWRELEAIYPALREGRPSPLPPPVKQYSECVEAQRRWLESPAFARQRDYWATHLAGVTPCDLPTDRPRPPVRSYRGDLAVIELPSPIAAGLRQVAQQADVTLFACLLGALDVLLARLSGQHDVAVMVPMAGRQRFGAESVIGYFANMVVLRMDVPDDLPFADLVRRASAEIMSGVFRQDVPFAKVIERLQPSRSLGEDPLTRVSLSFFSAEGSTLRLPGVLATFGEIPNGGAKFELNLIITERSEDLLVSAEYNTDVFDRETVQALLARYRLLLEGAATAPESCVADLPLLTPAERHQLLVTWNDTARPYPEHACLHQLFEAQTDRTPEAIAIVFERERITYRQLEQRANRLANHLRALGVGPEVLVGLCVERSADMIVAILGILKAGGAYVPLDPAYPKERLAATLEDARARVLITEGRAAPSLPAHGAQVVMLDADRSRIGGESDARPSSGVGPRNLAYTLFTSGSTGRPKGVAIEHRSPVALVAWAQQVYGPEDYAGTLFATSMCFDLSIFEMFVPLASGGKVIVARSALELSTLPAASEVTLINTVPSAMSELLRMGGIPASVRTVNLAGEPLSHELARRIYAVPTILRLLNLYGPTEDTTYSTFAEGNPATGLAPPIGRPLANGTAYVLDPRLQPVPTGVAGEVYLGGAGLARGYLHRPEMTAERFIANPYGEGRLYRTGDLARRKVDGTLEYIGRVDHQVKLRGFRIELGEIESILRTHEGVRDAVVLAREDTPGDRRLVAYVATGGVNPAVMPPDAAALRDLCRRKLPEYMVPGTYVALDALPLTPNGKVDRTALPTPVAPSRIAGAFAGPRDDVEAKVAAIFRNVLGVRSVGLRDSFFDLGGHSMLAVRLVAEIDRVFKRTIPLASLFSARTVEQISELLRKDPPSQPPGFQLVPIQPAGTKRPLFFISRPNVNSLGYVALSPHLDQDRPVYSVQYEYPEEGELGRPYTDEEYLHWATTYIDTIRLIQPQGPYLLGGMCEGALIAFTMTRVLEARGQRVAFLAMLDAWPLENTTRRLARRLFIYETRLRSLAGPSLPDTARAFAAMIERRLARSRNPQVAARPTANLWDERLYPGRDFVPPRVAAPITVLRAKAQAYWRIRDHELGWGNRTTGGVDVHVVPGDHDDLLREPHVADIARVIDACVRRADPQTPRT